MCVCGWYKYDNICKYFLVVVVFKLIFVVYLDFIRKKLKKNCNRIVFVEYDVCKEIVGKKGGKNKYVYWLVRGMV